MWKHDEIKERGCSWVSFPFTHHPVHTQLTNCAELTFRCSQHATTTQHKAHQAHPLTNTTPTRSSESSLHNTKDIKKKVHTYICITITSCTTANNQCIHSIVMVASRTAAIYHIIIASYDTSKYSSKAPLVSSTRGRTKWDTEGITTGGQMHKR